MSKKKYTDFSELGALVFSTDKNTSLGNSEKLPETLPPEKQSLQAVFSSKGRAGKIVTLIKGFVGKDEDLKNLAKMLKAQCGVGGSVKDGQVIIQGNHRDRIIEILRQKGFRIKRVGG